MLRQPSRNHRFHTVIVRLALPVGLALTTVAAAAEPVVAQSTEVTPVPDTVRLEDALELARAGNPELRKATNEVERAAAAERAGWGAFLPDVSVGGSMADVSSRTMTARNEFGQPVALDDPASFSATSAYGEVAASLTLFEGFRRVNALQAARAGSMAAEALEAGESVRVGAEVRRRFYAALAAERLVEVEGRLLAAAEERLSATEAMAEAGRATPQDVLGAEVDLARQQISTERASGEAYTQKLLLSELLGVSGEPAYVVAGEFPAAVSPDTLDADRLVALAQAGSPDVRRAEAMALRADHAADAARAVRWPRIQLNAGLAREVSLEDPEQLTSFPWNRGVSFGVSASVPVFTGLSASAQVADARVAQDNAGEDLRRARLATEREVRSALTALRLAHRSVALAERASELSRRRLDTGQEGFRRGLVTFTELQQLIEQAAQTERTAVRARQEYAVALATLNEAVGRDVTADSENPAGAGGPAGN